MLTPDCSLAPVREDKTEMSSCIPVNTTPEQQGQQGGASQYNKYWRESKHLFHKAMSTKSFNNLPPISKAKNQVLREQIQSYY